MTDFAALVSGVLESLDGAGSLADYLDENDRGKEAKLLRVRWKRWQTERRYAPHRAKAFWDEFSAAYAPEELKPPFSLKYFADSYVRGVDDRFCRYIMARFGDHLAEQPA